MHAYAQGHSIGWSKSKRRDRVIVNTNAIENLWKCANDYDDDEDCLEPLHVAS